MGTNDLFALVSVGFCDADPAFDAERNGYDAAWGPSPSRFGDPEAKKKQYRDVDEFESDYRPSLYDLFLEGDWPADCYDDLPGDTDDIADSSLPAWFDDDYSSDRDDVEDAVTVDTLHQPDEDYGYLLGRKKKHPVEKYYQVPVRIARKSWRTHSHRGRKHIERHNIVTVSVYISA